MAPYQLAEIDRPTLRHRARDDFTPACRSSMRLTVAQARRVTLADLATRLLRLLEATESKDASRVDSRRHLPVPLAVPSKSVEPPPRPRAHRRGVHVLCASELLERHGSVLVEIERSPQRFGILAVDRPGRSLLEPVERL